MSRAQNAPPPSYRWKSADQKDFAIAQTGVIDADAAGRGNESFELGAPRPQGELAVRPVL